MRACRIILLFEVVLAIRVHTQSSQLSSYYVLIPFSEVFVLWLRGLRKKP